jgi:hypothetical protein
MGYRDDLYALEARCDVLERDLQPRRAELRALDAEEQTLRREMSRRRFRIRMQRVLAWLRRHYLVTAAVVLATGIPGCLTLKTSVESFWERVHRGRALDRLGCHAVLEVRSRPAGAAVILGTRRLGTTPLRERLCPARYRVELRHPRALPWQRAVELPSAGPVRLEAALIPWRPSERLPGGSLFFSRPAGALVFVDGREVGRTPVFVAEAARGVREVAVAAPDHEPVVLRPRPRSTLWFNLAPRRTADARRAR